MVDNLMLTYHTPFHNFASIIVGLIIYFLIMKASKIIEDNGSFISLVFPYDNRIISKVRSFDGAYWNRAAKAWYIPNNEKILKELEHSFPDLEFDDSLKTFSQGNPHNSPVEPLPERKTVVITKTKIDKIRYLIIKPGTDETIVSITKSIEGARYDPSREGWLIKNKSENLRLIFKAFKGFAWVDANAVFEEAIIQPKVQKKSVPSSRVSLPELNEENAKKLVIFSDWIKSTRYSSSTLKTYTDSLRTFFRYLNNKPTGEITNQDLIDFNNHYILKNGYSASFQNQVINAIKLFFKKMEQRKLDIENIQRPRREKKLPNVLSRQEVERLINATSDNIKNRAMLSLIYSCGLRRGELLNLKLTDVDSDRGLLIIRNAKGKKDRVCPLSVKTIVLLRNYYKKERPVTFLFEGWKAGLKYSPRSLEEVMKKCVKLAAINKPVTLHWLRHSYATHLLESGTDLRTIQEVLGHKSSKTTEQYTHVSTRLIQQIRSPFDDLKLDE